MVVLYVGILVFSEGSIRTFGCIYNMKFILNEWIFPMIFTDCGTNFDIS